MSARPKIAPDAAPPDSSSAGHGKGVHRRSFLRDAGLLGLGAAALPFGAAARPIAEAPLGDGGRLTLAVPAAALHAPAARLLVGPVLQTLTRIGADSRVAPSLAESWESSADMATWTLALRADATWADGSPVGAGEVAANVAAWLAPGAPTTALLESMDDPETGGAAEGTVEVLDAGRLRLHLRRPLLALP